MSGVVDATREKKLLAAYTLYADVVFLAPQTATSRVPDELLPVAEDPERISEFDVCRLVLDVLRKGAVAARDMLLLKPNKMIVPGCLLVPLFVDSDAGATTAIAVKHGSPVEHRTMAPSTDGSPMVPPAAANNTIETPLAAGATANAGDADTATGAGRDALAVLARRTASAIQKTAIDRVNIGPIVDSSFAGIVEPCGAAQNGGSGDISASVEAATPLATLFPSLVFVDDSDTTSSEETSSVVGDSSSDSDEQTDDFLGDGVHYEISSDDEPTAQIRRHSINTIMVLIMAPVPLDDSRAWCLYAFDMHAKILNIMDPVHTLQDQEVMAGLHATNAELLLAGLGEVGLALVEGFTINRDEWDIEYNIGINNPCSLNESGVYLFHYTRNFTGANLAEQIDEDGLVVLRRKLFYDIMAMDGNAGETPGFMER
ncbi:hypothetical protein ZWY2020_016425 [Hordeum vulgare]|nr:hypothetical protein ZWY2020_016425 [Hordeum vulgare]